MPVYTIRPYITQWQGKRVWVFNDPSKGLINEGLVSGTDAILDKIASQFPDGEKGFDLTFGDEPFNGHQLVFNWVKSGTGEGFAEGVEGNWYTQKETGFNGWLCPALFKYFPSAPKHIYVKAGLLSGPLLNYESGEIHMPISIATQNPLRPETGPMQFGNDWPGVFIRGDNAMGYLLMLRQIQECLPADDLALANIMGLQSLINDLGGCDARTSPVVQKARLE